MNNRNTFDPGLFDGMDGRLDMCKRVVEIGDLLVKEGYVLASDSIDAVAALVISQSGHDLPQAIEHMDYIIHELNIFRSNIKNYVKG